MRKRSSCASGRGNVPCDSTGFCVAITRKGRSSFLVSPSTVTCFSSMHSRRLDCVLAVARLISSARSMFVKTGPFLNTKEFASRSKKLMPVRSDGRRSIVNCTRLKSRSSDWASAFAVFVFPVPGTSSSSTCPPTRRDTSKSSICLSFPTMTLLTFSVSFSENVFINKTAPSGRLRRAQRMPFHT